LLASKHSPLQHEAIRALGRNGTAAVAVPALLPIRDRTFGFGSDARALARDAIASIQARTSNAQAGSLALVSAGEGNLAVTED
jgi:hypothetical protein